MRGRTEARGHLKVNPGLFDEVRADVARLLGEDVPVANMNGRPPGNLRGTKVKESDTSDTILSRLKRDDPDMAQQVISGFYVQFLSHLSRPATMRSQRGHHGGQEQPNPPASGW